MPLLSRFKSKGAQPAGRKKAAAPSDGTNGLPVVPAKPRWTASWDSAVVELDEVQELIHACTVEMKTRAEALGAPFLLLPFRPDTDPSGARTFVRNFYKSNAEGSSNYRGAALQQELRLTEAVVLCSILKWCWSRLPSGVVSWPVYEGFQIGEKESDMARNAFDAFIPIGAGSDARKSIIFDFFDLLAAVAAHGKMNGLGGRKLSRLAGWWAFDHTDDGKGFEGGYKSWTAAADASSHLFFAYLRSLSPEADPSLSVIDRIPRSLQTLLSTTEYPPRAPTFLQHATPRVIMLVDSVSPTPFELLRRAKHFEYRDNDKVLRELSEFDDPVDALTDECKRILYAVAATNSAAPPQLPGREQAAAAAATTGQESWNAFQNLGFSNLELQQPPAATANGRSNPHTPSLRSQPQSPNADLGRPTTPSWADFLSSGFTDDDVAKSPTSPALSLPSDKVLPPLGSRVQTPLASTNGDDGPSLAPGELAAITTVELDDAFWWVWMTSLAGEEPAKRKAVFGRCALVETTIRQGTWLIMEEQVKGASPEPVEDVYIVPKKSLFGFTKRGGRSKKTAKTGKTSPAPLEPVTRTISATPSKTSLAPDQHSKIKATAAALARKQSDKDTESVTRRGRLDEASATKTSSTLTMGMMSEASPAMKWANAYDKKAVRAQYLGDALAGKGTSREDLLATTLPTHPNGLDVPAAPAAPKEDPATTKAAEATPAVSTAPPAPAVKVLPAADDDDSDVSPAPAPAPTSSALEKEIAVDAPTTPTAKRVDRKPVRAPDSLPEHPAFRKKSPDEPAVAPTPAPAAPAPSSPQSPTNPAAIAAQRAMAASQLSSSPEAAAPKPEHTKLKKQPGGAGLKKLFNRKKDHPYRQSVELSPPSTGKDSLAPPAESNVNRRFSLMRKKSSKGAAPATDSVAIAQPPPETLAEPTMPGLPGQFDNSPAASQVDTRSDLNAEDEFSRFDQGPMQDMPSAVPQDIDEHEPAPPAPPAVKEAAPASLAVPEEQEPEQSFVTPTERAEPVLETQPEVAPEVAPKAAPEVARETPPQAAPEVKPAAPEEEQPNIEDRWARIRDNAARRAARISEEQQQVQGKTNQSTRETSEDGETSGEETIESRVARIKARVAELTGNIEGNGTAAEHP